MYVGGWCEDPIEVEESCLELAPIHVLNVSAQGPLFAEPTRRLKQAREPRVVIEQANGISGAKKPKERRISDEFSLRSTSFDCVYWGCVY